MARSAVVTGGGRGFGREIARRLAGRGYAVLVTDIDEVAARSTADEIGDSAWSMAQDVRDPEGHRAAAAEAATRAPLAVWVNNAGVLRAGKGWEHPDDDVRLQVEANVLGVMWGSRAAVDAMKRGVAGPGARRAERSRGRGAGEAGGHIVNLASMSSFGPVAGLAVYGATKHAVLGFTSSLQGDLDEAGIPVRVHALCPDAANTELVQGVRHEPDSAMLFSGGRLLTPEEVAERAVGLLDSKRIVLAVPRRRAAIARFGGIAPRVGLALERPMKRKAERRRRRG
jgi:NAD(P)-dependent dehydrogenase (short-subunit alcohol dehydrogenase family)